MAHRPRRSWPEARGSRVKVERAGGWFAIAGNYDAGLQSLRAGFE